MIEQIGWSLVSICHSTESPAGGRVVEDWDLIASSLQGKGQTNELCILSVKNAESNKKYTFLHSAFFFSTQMSLFQPVPPIYAYVSLIFCQTFGSKTCVSKIQERNKMTNALWALPFTHWLVYK